jgi:hypothetical protein
MNEVLEIYLKVTMDLSEVANRVMASTGWQMKERYGENRGGAYFDGERGGVYCELLQNVGEVKIPEREGWPYYLILSSNAGAGMVRTVADDLVRKLVAGGIPSEIDTLT